VSDAEVTTAFTKFYMQRATTEFSEELDRLRGADDFRDDALPLLINALQQGTFLFSIEEQKRIVMAGTKKEEKKADD
jgi:ribosome assembly protein 3